MAPPTLQELVVNERNQQPVRVRKELNRRGLVLVFVASPKAFLSRAIYSFVCVASISLTVADARLYWLKRVGSFFSFFPVAVDFDVHTTSTHHANTPFSNIKSD